MDSNFLQRTLLFLSILITLQYYGCHCEVNENGNICDELSSWYRKRSAQIYYLNQLTASMAWDMATEQTNSSYIERGIELGFMKEEMKASYCTRYSRIPNPYERRMMYLFCRGPKYTLEELKNITFLANNISDTYVQERLCIDKSHWLYQKISQQFGNQEVCLQGEQDFDKQMRRKDLSPAELYWIWDAWYSVGIKIKPLYPTFVEVMNQGAKRNFYKDIGAAWREEIEIPHLDNYVLELYSKVQSLYKMLHAVVRFKLAQKYGSDVIDPTGLIPAHLLGNLWGQDWSSLMDLFFTTENDLDDNILKKKWTAKDMVVLAEDFYVSMGFPRMTKQFWYYSKFEETNSSMCHGSAANMFSPDDYRMLLCAKLCMEDFYVIHHEMGHIEYYMAYSDLPAIFQDGGNSAMQESIGDAIMTGVMSPSHLFRLGLISEERLFNESFDMVLLLRQALSKIPQIPYGLMVDYYRWNIFNGRIDERDYNLAFWELNEILRGIKTPGSLKRDESYYFDAAAKFHVADNTPYIRYFLASFMQVDVFSTLCQWSVYGKVTDGPLPSPLHRCDIYGAKSAGKQLRKMMSLGASRPWTEIYESFTGRKYISHEPLLEYYKPVYKWLENYISEHNIPVGWL